VLKRIYLPGLILLLAAFLLFYKLSDFMPFIGDQAWFFLSARDMIIYHHVPLVGITSSHVWLHQGPYWTYMLASALWIGRFNPVAGGYLSGLIGLVTVFLVYKIGSEVFSKRVGLISSLIYATLPLVIFFARMPYHTESIAPLTLLLFYALYKWMNGYKYGLPLIILLFALLYNFELSTFMLVPIFIIVLAYGLYKKTKWSKDIFKPKLIGLSILAWVVIMIPMIFYDVHHGYPQTIKFIIWVGYKVATVFGYPNIHPDAHGETLQTMIPFALILVRRMIFYKSVFISLLIVCVSFVTLIGINKKYFKKREFLQPYSLLLLFFLISVVVYIAEKTNSDAYWIVFFPTIAFMIALVFDRLMSIKKLFYPSLGLLLVFTLCNSISFFQSNFFMNPQDYGFPYSQRVKIAKTIITESKGKPFSIIGGAPKPWSQYPSFTMEYQYLTWWMGHPVSTSPHTIRFTIYEYGQKDTILKESKK
jgi:4-amino-4-deoxy-L-arabinose transferase-like glycosyltransferase